MYQNQPTPDQLALQQNTEAAEVEIQTTNDAGLIRPSISIDKADNEGDFKYNLETSAEKENYLVLENNLLGLNLVGTSLVEAISLKYPAQKYHHLVVLVTISRTQDYFLHLNLLQLVLVMFKR